MINSNKVLLPPLRIKLGLMKQFAKVLNKESECTAYLCQMFPELSIEKLRAGIFDDPQIRCLMQNKCFSLTMTTLKKNTWRSFTAVAENFLKNFKAPNYHELLKQLLNFYEQLGCNVSVKVHFLHSHANYFPENLRAMSEEHGERFHQNIMKKRYQGR